MGETGLGCIGVRWIGLDGGGTFCEAFTAKSKAPSVGEVTYVE